MKKTLSILLVAILAISSVIGVSAATKNFITSTPEGAPHRAPQSAPHTAPQGTPHRAPQSKQTDEVLYDIPNFIGTWKHETNDGCSVQVVSQDENKIDLTIQSCNENFTKIATSRLSLELTTWTEGDKVFGSAKFNYYDSFGSGGRGSIVITDDKLTLTLNKEFDPCAAWNISACEGDFFLDSRNIDPNEKQRFDHLSENQQIPTGQVEVPDFEGLWKSTTNMGASIEVLNQQGSDMDLVIELHNEDLTKIATANVFVSLNITPNDGNTGIETATADFEYCDSFGSCGTGTITFDDEGRLFLELNEENTGAWSIAPAAGEFTMQ